MNSLSLNIGDELPPEIQEITEALKAQQLAKIEQIGKYVAKKRDEAVKGRKASGIETIWQEDQEYYQGIDEASRDSHTWLKSPSTSGGMTRDPAKKANRCTSFFNITRQFVESASARMGDILLPAGDWNFACKATPVQDEQLNNVAQALPTMAAPSGADPSGVPGAAATTPGPVQLEAERRAEKAETWIQDKLVECSYHSEVRMVIEDAAGIGTGVLKGPFPKKSTQRKAAKDANGNFTLEIALATTPASKHVDPWDCFPDPCCGDNIHNGAYFVERDRMLPHQLKDLKGLPGYLDVQIDKVLDEGPDKKNYHDGVRKTDGDHDDEMFHVWYFHGYIGADSLSAMNVVLNDKESAKNQLPAIVTLVNDTPIKATISPMDSGEFPYDFMPWQRVAGSPWGIGIARQGRTAQDMLNASARALMDNAGLSSGPMLIITRGEIEPADGKWEVTPRKVWWRTAEQSGQREAFQAIDIPMMQVEMTNIIQLAYKMMEDATGISYLLQGQQGSAPDTVGGMELLHRNASAILRRLARVFDERVTEPHIRRYYEWLLLHGPDDCKGDMKIEAIGSTALVEREIQSMQSMQLLNFSVNPVFGLDPAKAMEQVLRAQRFIPEKWTRDANNPAPAPMIPALEVAKIRSADNDKKLALDKDKMIADNMIEKHRIDVGISQDNVYQQVMLDRDKSTAQSRLQELVTKRELAMLDYSNKHGIALNDVKARLAETAMRLKVQKQLAGLAQVTAPPTEPPQHAADGHAFEE
jgi:hypothetical protein